jgi:outer membrane protein TolC
MLALIDAERSLRTAELNHYEALADSFSRRAELDRALGRLPFAVAAPAASPPTASDETETER